MNDLVKSLVFSAVFRKREQVLRQVLVDSMNCRVRRRRPSLSAADPDDHTLDRCATQMWKRNQVSFYKFRQIGVKVRTTLVRTLFSPKSPEAAMSELVAQPHEGASVNASFD